VIATGLQRAAGRACWLTLAAAVAVHGVLAALALTEYASLGWLPQTPYDLASVTVMQASAAVGLAASGLVAARAAAGSRALARTLRSGRAPLPPALRDAATALAVTSRVDVVAADEPLALTYRLARPRIMVSTGLIAVLTAAELSAVLAHERCHLRQRDPLRLLAARLLAAYGCYLPITGWLARRLALRRELAADRAAAGFAGRGVLAGALLKLTTAPARPAVASASPAGDAAQSMAARIAQLENRRPAGPRLAPGRLLTTVGNLMLLLAAGTCCVSLAQALPFGLT
jgi:Zn-dependent protease with chaperone function